MTITPGQPGTKDDRDTIDLRDREQSAHDTTSRAEAPHEEASRGRRADAPHEIPARGWRDVAVRVKDEARDDNLTLVAAGIAFYSLLSLAPALVAAVSIYGLVSTPEDVARNIGGLTDTMPSEARTLVTEQLNQVVSSSKGGLSIGVVVGVLVAIWGASSAMHHLMVALSSIYDEHETRGFVKLRTRAIVLTVLGVLFLGVSVLLLTVVPGWAGGTGDDVRSTVVSVLRWPVLMALMVAALAFLYRYAPDRDEPKWRWVSWGSGLATLLWIVGSIAFSFYASHFGSYNKTYGTMAAVVVLMLWLFLTAACVLLGAEVNAELEHQTAEDSTRGPSQPQGDRDAYVADTVGAASS